MKGPAFLLALGDGGWRIARIRGGEVELREVRSDSPQQSESIEAVAPALAELGYAGEDVCLALPSNMVLSAEIDCSNLPRKQRRSGMIFRLEEQLPLDAERLTVDFLRPRAGRALGLAVETEEIESIIEALTKAGVEIQSICPFALLAAWEPCQDQSVSADYVILVEDTSIDVLRNVEGQPKAWYTVAADKNELVRCVRADLLANPTASERPTATLLGRPDPNVLAALREEAGLELTVGREEQPIFAAARTALRILTGESVGWIDLRRDRLAPASPWRRVGGLVRSAMTLGLLLLVILTAGFHWRGARYGRTAELAYQEQEKLYRDLHDLQPGRSVPAAITRRLRSDLKHIYGVSDAGGDLPPRISALDTLRGIITSLPETLRLRIVEIRIEPSGILIEGQARDHSAAEVVAQALRRAGVDADPPRTEHLVRGGVSFLIGAKRAGPAKPAGPAGGGQ